MKIANSIRPLCGAALVAFSLAGAWAQPSAVKGGIRFTYRGPAISSVSLVGDFNGWSRNENPLAKDASGLWSVTRQLSPGIYQYKFVIDGEQYLLDPGNPAAIDNYNNTARNSVFVLTPEGTIQLTSVPPFPKANPQDVYPPAPGRKPVYLNIIWHQHQPLYVNPEFDQLSGPWVRTHATKDYYDMAAMLRGYPAVHCTINLTSSLILQLRTYYIDRLGPFIDVQTNTMDVAGFLKKWRGKTDPWIDLALTPTSAFTHTDKDMLYRNPWNAFGVSDVMMSRFPEYFSLFQKLKAGTPSDDALFGEQELREIKFWFFLASFDPDFLHGRVTLPDSSVCDLSDYLEFRADKKFYLRKKVGEADCQRMVVEAYKVMKNILPIHQYLRYRPDSRTGQVEIITTPYYHPILPLIYDSDLARMCQPNDTLPPRFSYPEDADAQVAKAVAMYTGIFGTAPTGMWPGEGSVAQPVLATIRDNGVLWTASDAKILARSEPPHQPNTRAFRFPAGAGRSITVVFRDTELSDRIGFKYQNYEGEEAAEDFITTILSMAPQKNDEDVLITVILDGENAWEWYREDIDGKEFLHALYRKLSLLYAQKRVITTTMIEHINGNPARGIAAHPVESQPAMTHIWPGSWINANFDTWIGEREENTAWAYLLRARQDLTTSGIPRPNPKSEPPQEGTNAWYGWKAWEELYAAEGSDWFWWFGDDQTAPGGDKPFDIAYRTHLENIYRSAQRAGAAITSPGFAPIIQNEQPARGGQGTMARSRAKVQSVLFVCDATAENVARNICIAGNLEQLARWKPNVIRMYDDGTHGDQKAGDGLWSLLIDVPLGMEIQYKYTNSGEPGQWIPGEEFPSRHRTITIAISSPAPFIIKDTFGK